MPSGCFIGIDQGSSSTKALLVGPTGTVLFRTRRDLSPPFRQGPRVEQDAGEILLSVLDALQDCLRHARSTGSLVLGAGLSCQRSSCLVWDGSTGEPLSPVLSWRDTRGAGLIESLAAERDHIFSKTGLPLTPHYSASKFRWLKENVPAAQARTAVFGTLSSFLVQRLAQAERPSIDHTNAARTQIMNIRTLAWDDSLLDLFGLSGIRLPAITPTAGDFGTVRTSSGDAPLLACIGDQQAAMLGLGVTDEGDGGLNYGTGGFLMVNTGAVLVPADGLMASVHYSLDRETRYLLEGSVNAVGDALAWLRERFSLFRDTGEVDDLCWKASTDVVAFLAMNGTGAPHWETGISSSLHGLTADSSAADIVRGAVEGVAFFMKDIFEAIRAGGLTPSSFVAAGGLSSLSYLVQVQADLFGKDLTVNVEEEASARGAAFLAGMRYGAWSRTDIKAAAGAGDRVEKRENPGILRRYERWKALHRVTGMLDQR